VKVDAQLRAEELSRMAYDARLLEAHGVAGLFSSETTHDPFLPVLLAAEHTKRADVGTAVAIAFGRSPMTVAAEAHDLQRYSNGRFILGLGTQVEAHITRRYSMPWPASPVERMREFVEAVRAIWASWNDGVPLDHAGGYYTHTLMTPFFAHPPAEKGPPRVFLAGVGPRMIRLAGEVADGLILHVFNSAAYIAHVILDSLAAGLTSAHRGRDGFEVVGHIMIVTGSDEAELAAAREATRERIAFYASTRAYRAVLEQHGWEQLQGELAGLAKQGRWSTMAELVTDDILNEFAIVGTPDTIGHQVDARFDGIVDRIQLEMPTQQSSETMIRILSDWPRPKESARRAQRNQVAPRIGDRRRD
jgi:probable F420-dependent oxidoreductase